MMGSEIPISDQARMLWFADSSATTHVCNDNSVMNDLQPVNGNFNGVNGSGGYQYIRKVDLELSPTYYRGRKTNQKMLKLTNIT